MKFGAALSEELRDKYRKRTASPRVGDSVKILRGEYKNIEGKVTKVMPKEGKLNVEGVTHEKQKGGTSPIPVHASNVIITSLNLDDKLRKQKLEEEE
jgi:large subunit ribosomal protein L24